MGPSPAYPVFRTADADEACGLAMGLCTFLEGIDEEMWLGAEPRTPEEGRRVAAAVPELPSTTR